MKRTAAYTMIDNRVRRTADFCGLLLILLAIATYLYLSTFRLFATFELEWYEGIMLSHAARIVHGLQLYVKPTPEFVDALYQPLYYYVAALAMKVGGLTYTVGRSVSYVATLCSAAIGFFVVFRITKQQYLSIVASGVFLTSFAVTGYTYDIARIDPLFLLFLVVATAALILKDSTSAVLAAGFSLVCAYFTKQEVIFYLPVFVLWLGMRSRRRAVLFCLQFVLLITIGTIWLQATSHGWYWYYVFTIPKVKSTSFGWGRVLGVFPNYLLTSWGIAAFAIFAQMTIVRRIREYLINSDGLIFLLFIVAIIQTGMHLGDRMSYKNVAVPLAFYTAVAFPIAVYRFSIASDFALQTLFRIAIPLQMLALLYNPFQQPLVVLKGGETEAFNVFLHQLQAVPGDLLIPAHSFFPEMAGKVSHANIQCLQDVLLVDDSAAHDLRRALDEKLANHAYVMIIRDANPLTPVDSIPGYQLTGEINTGRFPFQTQLGAYATSPRYVYRPRN